MHYRIRQFLGFSSFLLLGACDAGPEFGLDIVAAPVSVKASEAVSITVTLVNLSTKVRQVASPLGSCGFRPYQILDSQGDMVSFPGVICTLVGYSPVELQPGESVAYRSSWTPTSTSIGGQPVGAGRYRIVGRDADNISARSHAEVEVVP